MIWRCDMCAPPCLMRTAGGKPQCLNTLLQSGIAEWVHVEYVKMNFVVDI